MSTVELNNLRMICQDLPRVIIHCDINKTIIMSDNVSNFDIEKTLNSLLSECIWGRIKHGKKSEENNEEKDIIYTLDDWEIISTIPSSNPPEIDSITFGEYLEKYMMKFMTRDEMKKYKSTFTQNGNIGETCRDSYQKIFDALQFNIKINGNDEELEEGNNVIDFQADENKSHASPSFDSMLHHSISLSRIDLYPELTKSVLKDGQYHIIPSFFYLISVLDDLKIDFRIIFRTFGVDIAKVAAEFNTYCEGNHPVLHHTEFIKSLPSIEIQQKYSFVNKKMDGSDGSIDRRLHLPSFSGKITRNGINSNDVHLAHLSHERVSCMFYF